MYKIKIYSENKQEKCRNNEGDGFCIAHREQSDAKSNLAEHVFKHVPLCVSFKLERHKKCN